MQIVCVCWGGGQGRCVLASRKYGNGKWKKTIKKNNQPQLWLSPVRSSLAGCCHFSATEVDPGKGQEELKGNYNFQNKLWRDVIIRWREED